MAAGGVLDLGEGGLLVVVGEPLRDGVEGHGVVAESALLEFGEKGAYLGLSPLHMNMTCSSAGRGMLTFVKICFCFALRFIFIEFLHALTNDIQLKESNHGGTNMESLCHRSPSSIPTYSIYQ